MRIVFRHYSRPSRDDLARLWSAALFSFDASVLLNLYGYTDKTREALVHLAEDYAERLRLPYQFGLEYVRNRRNVIQKQISKYKNVEDRLEEIRKEILSTRDHPYLSDGGMSAYEGIQQELNSSRSAIANLLESDPHEEKILRLFEERVGRCPSAEELSRMEAAAQQRYDKKIPPGYMDLKEKGPTGAFGDYIGWRQLMDIAKAEGRGFIFVVDDLKQDWWWDLERTLPRPELLTEFLSETQHEMYMYTSENFLRAAREFGAAEIADDAIEEVRQLLENLRAKDLKPSVAEEQKPATPATTEKPLSPAVLEKPSVAEPGFDQNDPESEESSEKQR